MKRLEHDFSKSIAQIRDEYTIGLAQCFLEMENTLNKLSEVDTNREIDVERIAEKQDAVIKKIVQRRSPNICSALAKLKIWINDAPDIQNPDELSRHDSLVLSAYRDLSGVCLRCGGCEAGARLR